jgi:tRNA G18 (ribose-2'-O)-methylase SpoU
MGNMIGICQILEMEKWCINQGRMDALSSSLSRSRVRASTVANITLIDETRERNMAVLAGTSGVWAVGAERAATAAVFFSFNLDEMCIIILVKDN